MIAAAQAVIFGDAGGKARHAMRAALTDEAQIAAAVAVEHEILAEDPHRRHRVLGQLRFRIDRVPVTAQQLAARSAGPDAR